VTEEETSPVLLGVLIALLGTSTAFSFGYLKHRLERANSDYKDTKAKVLPLRKAYWAAWWAATKVGFWVFIIGLLLVAWVLNDAQK
jgi:ABC-type Fe3+ transport system permease subunit